MGGYQGKHRKPGYGDCAGLGCVPSSLIKSFSGFDHRRLLGTEGEIFVSGDFLWEKKVTLAWFSKLLTYIPFIKNSQDKTLCRAYLGGMQTLLPFSSYSKGLAMEKGFYLLCLKDWASIVSYGDIQRNLPRCSLYVRVRLLEIPFIGGKI